MNNLKMNIAFSASREYMKYAEVMLMSLFETNDYEISIYLFYYEEMPFYFNKIKKIVEKYRNKLYLTKITEEQHELTRECPGWNPSLWYRWTCLDLLDETVDRILILGLDIIFQGDISQFYVQDLYNYYFVMCKDMNIANNDCSSLNENLINDAKKWGVSLEKEYHNADVVLVNLKNNKELSFSQFIGYYKKYKFIFLDQDIINYLYKDKIKTLSWEKYNYIPNLRLEMIKDNDSLSKAIIVHFLDFLKLLLYHL